MSQASSRILTAHLLVVNKYYQQSKRGNIDKVYIDKWDYYVFAEYYYYELVTESLLSVVMLKLLI